MKEQVETPIHCQLTAIPDALTRRGLAHRFSNDRVRVLRSVKRRVLRLYQMAARRAGGPAAGPVFPSEAGPALHPGDVVRIRSRKEIKRSLDADGRTRGCAFTHEMYRYCGRTFRVKKGVEVFFDEARQKMSRCHNMFVLEGAVCNGRQRLYAVKCDRNCHFFWQIEWLDRSD